LLFALDNTVYDFSDTYGVVNFQLKSPNHTDGRLIIESDQYEIQEQAIADISDDKRVDVRLKKKQDASTDTLSKVIFRVIDEENENVIQGAEIALVIDSQIHRENTDSYGFATFSLSFKSGSSLDGQIYVTTKNFRSKAENITLSPDRVRDVRLDSNKNVLKLAEVASTQLSQSGAKQLPNDTPQPQVAKQPGNDSIAQTTAPTAIVPSGIDGARPAIHVKITYLEFG
jgi:hypothetical protein